MIVSLCLVLCMEMEQDPRGVKFVIVLVKFRVDQEWSRHEAYKTKAVIEKD